MRYLCDPHILPTVVPREWSDVASYVQSVGSYTDWMHVDIDDGVFVDIKTWPFNNVTQLEELRQLRLGGSVSMELHLMIKQNLDVYECFAQAGFKRIVFHVESFDTAEDVQRTIALCRSAGTNEIGLALKIDTPLAAIDEFVSAIDYALLMSITKIGPQGQPFNDTALSRVEELHAKHPDLMVAVDGGVGESNIEDLVRAGANRLCVGSAISKSDNPAQAFARLHERAMRGCTPPVLAETV